MEQESKPASEVAGRDRLDGLLALHDQSRKRFSEVETLEWRVNFATWAFTAGIAYLFRGDLSKSGGVAVPHWAIIAFVVLLVILHLTSLTLLNRSAFHHRRWADYYRDHIKRRLGLPSEHLEPPALKYSLTGAYKLWIVIECSATILLATAVTALIW